MSSSPYLMGIDIGTEGCKAILFNAKGKSLARSYQEYPIIVPEPSWAEQDPHLWWNAVRKTVSDITKKVNVHPGQIECVSLAGQSPVLVPVDKRGNPLMNAIIWMDRRAVRQTRTITRIVGITEDPSMILPKIIWVKEQHPQVFRKAHKFLQSTDFIEYKLTGNFVTNWLNAITCHFDVSEDRWSETVLNQLEIPIQKLPDVFRPTEIVGTVTEQASRETGLKKGTPVAAGGIDAYMAMIGVNALRTGCACEITGSSTCLMIPSNRKVSDPEGRVKCEPFPMLPNFWVTWGVMSSTGASLKWFRDTFGYPSESYEDLDVEAAKAPPGSQRLIFLPYMMGERSPIWNPTARGVLVGLSLNHSRKHVVRAILEGCAFGIRHNLETIEGLGAEINEIRSCGGAARSRIFGQIKADVTGKPIIIPEEIEATALGAAIVGAVGVRVYGDIKEASENMIKVKSRINPKKTSHKKYTSSFQMYKDAYLYLKEYFKRYYSPKNVGPN
ncbi:xylulokinase [Candidatus Bathyarchaeota archaeon]|nr:xylulokinase [Candidatus Bathyarchaeota archaeon]